MAKLKVTLNHRIETGSLHAHNKKTFKTDHLTGKPVEKLFSSIDQDELGFEVVSTNEEIESSFFFSRKTMKKGAILDVTVNPESNGLNATIEGEFEITLRAGAVPLLKQCGDKLDLRIRGIAYKGGAYNGFMGWVRGSDYEQEKENWRETFPKIEKFSIK